MKHTVAIYTHLLAAPSERGLDAGTELDVTVRRSNLDYAQREVGGVSGTRRGQCEARAVWHETRVGACEARGMMHEV